MRKIFVDPAYSLDVDSIKPHADTVLIGDKYYINSDSVF
jgi:hypothetical protein